MRAALLAVLVALSLGVNVAGAQTRENPIRIAIDGRDWSRHVLHARIAFPASPGPMTLYFPKWIPGTHRPEGPIADLTGLVMSANGARVPWSRDTLDNFTFHVDVPAGAHELEVRLDALNLPATPDEGFVEWHTVVMYPAGTPVSRLFYRATMQLPDGWTCATALDSTGASADGIEYATVSLETLVDSPVLAGAHSRRLDLGSLFGAPVTAHIYCESPEGLEFKPEFEKRLRGIVREAGALFGARHFDHYRFLIGLGLKGDLTVEHHQSNVYVAKERSLLELGDAPLALSDLGHEMAHSWCGKYRRPVGLTFTDYQHPENSELLWVYEGLNQYLGYVLNGRSGMYGPASARMQFIRGGLSQSYRSGRVWRNLRDTAIGNDMLRNASDAGYHWRRAQDYYVEGALIWIEADATIRRLSRGRKSLDDFCKLFLGGANTGAQVNPYSEDQVVAALAAVQPYDWRTFLDERVRGLDTPEPARALEAVGWKFTLADSMDDYESAAQAIYGADGNLTYSLGIDIGDEGAVEDVVPDGPADRAGLGAGMKLIGVDGRVYSKQVMIDALKSAQKTKRSIELLATTGGRYRTFQVDCTTGPQYPAGERIAGTTDVLSQVLHLKPVAAPARTKTASR